jgi:voltage-gated potassium channel Kch
MNPPRSYPRTWQRLLPRFLIVFGALTVLLGFWGLATAHTQRGLLHAITAVLFDVAGMLMLEKPRSDTDNVPVSLARVTAVITVGLGVLYVVLGVYRESADQMRLWRFGWRATRRRRPLVVICGLGRIGRQLVNDLTAAGARSRASVVAIEVDAGNPRIQSARDRGAVVVVGDARDPAARRRARLDAAERAFVVCGDDSVNLDVAAEIVRDVEGGGAARGGVLHCHANIVSPSLAAAAGDSPGFAAVQGRVRFEAFNVVENAARQLVKDELARRHAPNRDEAAHYIIVGFGTMGQAVALQAGKLAHFENDRRLRLTIVDDWEEPAVRKSMRRFLERYPAFCPDPAAFDLAEHIRDPSPDKDLWSYRAGRPADAGWRMDAPMGPTGEPIPIEYVVNAEFLDLPTDVDAPRLMERVSNRLQPPAAPAVRPCVVVCFDDDRRNLEAALRISAALRRAGLDPPLYVYLPEEPGLATFLRRGREEGGLGEVRSFGACEDSAAYSRLVQPRIIDLATTFRASYRTARNAAGDTAAGDGPLDLGFWASNQEAAHHVDVKLAAVERMRDGRGGEPGGAGEEGMFTPGAREALARMEHNRWVAERLLAGWRYGPRDDIGRRRDSLIAWRHLPEEERVKDFEQVDALARWLDGPGA